MARKAVVDAVLGRLGPVVMTDGAPSRHWQPSAGDPVPVIGPNETGDADPAGGMFIAVEFPLANEDQMTIGAPGQNVWREEGVFRIIIAAERNSGLNQALSWADELAARFRGASFDGVQCWAVTSSQMDARNEESGWYRLAVAVGYEHHLYG